MGKCIKCGAEEVPFHSPFTLYACGTMSYDERPGTWRFTEKCLERVPGIHETVAADLKNIVAMEGMTPNQENLAAVVRYAKRALNAIGDGKQGAPGLTGEPELLPHTVRVTDWKGDPRVDWDLGGAQGQGFQSGKRPVGGVPKAHPRRVFGLRQNYDRPGGPLMGAKWIFPRLERRWPKPFGAFFWTPSVKRWNDGAVWFMWGFWILVVRDAKKANRE